MTGLIYFLGIFIVLIVALFVVDNQIAAPKYKEGSSNHFDGKKFVNPDDADTHHYLDVLKWWFSSNNKPVWHKITEEAMPKFRGPEINPADDHLEVTFVNHSTFLLQVDGLNILTDPIWGYRASPYQWVGPKRMRPPGLKFENLPPVDVVLISHNHYDHLDIETVKRLHREHDPVFVVPLGVEKYLKQHHINAVTHLDWWDKHTLKNNLSLTCVPARHFAGRGLFDRNATLWCGYVLHTSLGNIYFAGDTGYGSFFKKIGEQFGPMMASLIPIGAYKPKWFMESIHISPAQAVQVHKEVQSKQSFATHFGTFPLADDGMFDAVKDLEKQLAKDELPQEQFLILKEGESKTVQRLKQSSTVL